MTQSLILFQARIQAQQLAEKENKLLQFLEDRQEAQIRRVAYGRDASYSATSLSSNSSNSMTAGVGVRPGWFEITSKPARYKIIFVALSASTISLH